ncbi:MAG TPA: hypothetical protein VN541_23235, partial [Tepidisphaeraceae bacterium]|nr:hypothetical protein [Tepidisphaeraceae bacterium]
GPAYFPRCLAVGILALGLTGCAASYATPGRAADMRVFGLSRDQQSDASIVKVLDKQPLAKLPTAIAVVRVQESGYKSTTEEGWGHGAYSIVNTRDIEGNDELARKLSKLPMVSGIAPLSRLLLPQELNSDMELRQAAAALHADMLLVYTLDTTFNVEDVAAPLTVVTLGLSPNQVVHVTCTASAALVDTRNGYVYGVSEATDRQNQLASGWTSPAAVDQTRRRVESTAYAKLVANLCDLWPQITKNLSKQ